MHRSFASLRMTNSEGFRIFNSAADKSSTPRLPAPACDSAAISKPFAGVEPLLMLRDHDALITHQLRLRQCRQRLRVVLLHRVGRVEKHIIESGPRRLQLPQRFPSVDADDLEPAGNPKDFKLAAITSAAARDDSTKYTIRAPRLSASMPTAPVPAYKSIQVDSANAAGSPEQSMLNSVSRRRSAVGRISVPGSDRNVRRRYSPAITLIVRNPSFLATIFRSDRANVSSAQPFRFPFRISAGWVGV